MAFRRKCHLILEHNPDIAIIQECEDPRHHGHWHDFTDHAWIGENPNKGLGIFVRNGFCLEPAGSDLHFYGDFAATVRLLTIQGLGSAYHLVHHCDFGNEPYATFYMHRRKDRPYHIDYVFVPRKKFPELVEFQLGVYDEWAGASDHMPIILEISL